ncbi:methyltransferase domain-containing protein, partial [Streptomyces sp. SID2131]|nr:methyltransferase domain-containing protein [Streptomyces sp. SID2131]
MRDETLFAGAAASYGRGRPPYAPGLVDALAGAPGLDGRERLLDVGCGPGTLALPLAPLFEEVVGVDPDGGMLAEAWRWSPWPTTSRRSGPSRAFRTAIGRLVARYLGPVRR